jgi:hypothetical protein
MDKNQQAKREVIATFFDIAEARVAFLSELAQTGHKSEAMTLCLTYIDSFAQWLCWPATSSGRNFVEAVIQFGDEPLMGLAHPLEAVHAFGSMKAPWQIIAEKIDHTSPGPPYELLPLTTFVDMLVGVLTSTELKQLKQEMWRATMANVVYQSLRNPSVHAFGASSGIWLSQTTYEGASVPPVGFHQLLRCVRGLVNEARRRSEANWQWFGNDAIVNGA